MAAKPDSRTAPPAARDLVITRVFDAPRSVVWKAWTDPLHLMQWWGPNDYTSPACKIDLRVGGKYLFCMKSKEGQVFWSTGVYKEIVPLEKIVCTDNFADEKGNVVPASHYGIPGEWPDGLLVTILFEDLNGKTKMTLRHSGLPAKDMIEMTGNSWNESFDKLVAIVSQH